MRCPERLNMDIEFSEIIKTTKPVVLGAVKKYLAARFYSAIDDVVQETYLRSYRALTKGKFRNDSKIETWIYTIARNESLRMNSKLQREEIKSLKIYSSLKHKEELISADTDRHDTIEYLMSLIKKLPHKYRSVLEMSALGHSEEEIAKTLNIKKGTVKSRAFRGRSLIFKLAKGGDEL